MNPIPHSLERWLVLDEPVFRFIAQDAGEPHELLPLRLEQRLIEQVPRPLLARRLSALRAAGFGHVHVVAQTVDAALLRELRPLVSEQLRIDVHDWYRSPDAVMAALDAPDLFVVDCLKPAKPEAVQIWPPIGAACSAPGFLGRYRAALEAWERDARNEHGEDFTDLYGPAIAWDRVLPLAKARPDEPAGRTGLVEGFRRVLRRVADSTRRGASPDLRGLAFAMDGEESAGQALEWSYTLDLGEVALRIELPSRPGANVELIAALGPGIAPPPGFALVDESGDVIVAALTRQWLPSGAEGERISYHAFKDEFGDLRARLNALRVQPVLLFARE